MTRAVSKRAFFKGNVMKRTQVPLTDFCVTWYNIVPPPYIIRVKVIYTKLISWIYLNSFTRCYSFFPELKSINVGIVINNIVF